MTLARRRLQPPRRLPAIGLALGLACMTGPSMAATANPYATAGTCAGLPAVPLQLARGFCAGLAAYGLGTPRGVLPLADGRVLVTDLGRWDGRTGRLLQLTPGPTGYMVRSLLGGLNRPHGLQLGPDGRVYIGEAHRIGRIALDKTPPTLETVFDGLPADGRHPLKSFVFGPDGALYLNRGAPSDHCENAIASRNGARRCDEAEKDDAAAAIWRYAPADGRWTGKLHARGLRNSMALAFAPGGALWQGENSRDELPGGGSAESRPHDELNLIRPGAHYGWPYCTDNGVFDPGFRPGDCTRYTPPKRLLPAHSAPLGMAFYDAPNAPPGWRNSLVITLHGYRSQGHRIIGYRLDKDGLPAPRFEVLVDGWKAHAGRPLGAPTDIKADTRGRLWLTEDRNGTLLVISPK